MRALSLIFAIALAAPGFAAMAAPVVLPSTVVAVTLYPSGAEVTRRVTLPKGVAGAQVVVPDLPASVAPGDLRISLPDGLGLASWSLRQGREIPTELPKRPDQLAALAALEQASAALQKAEDDRAAITAQVDAANAQADFLRRASPTLDGGLPAAQLLALSQAVGDGVLEAARRAMAARAGLPAADLAVTQASTARDAAQAALDALSAAATDAQTLTLNLSGQGAGDVLITAFVADAGWQPVYDLRLDSRASRAQLDRAAVIHQASGEDWGDVALTLSTAQPGGQTTIDIPYGDLARIGPPVAEPPLADAVAAPAPTAVMEKAVMAPAPQFMPDGQTVVYAYPVPVNLASGVEDTRLALDQIALPAQIEARAIAPAWESENPAYLIAHLQNAGAEQILPGHAQLYRDGVLVGGTDLGQIVPGQTQEVGFGPIDGLRIATALPARNEGAEGLFQTANRKEVRRDITLQNLTQQDWTVTLYAGASYSEQKDLSVRLTADPAPQSQTASGRPGVLQWVLPLPAGARSAVHLTETLTWPDGQVLQ